VTYTGPVRPPVMPFTDDDVREITRAVLLPLCSDMGPTRVARALGGVDERTIRRAREEQTTLCMDTMANLLLLDDTAFDGFLAKVGRRSVPIGSICDTDALPAMTGAVHRLVMAASPTSPGGASLRASWDAIGGLLNRIDGIKRGAAA
jgi:hypothetical protein